VSDPKQEPDELLEAIERAARLQKENEYACALIKRDMLEPLWLRQLKTGDPR
jgi:hypothetical protein